MKKIVWPKTDGCYVSPLNQEAAHNQAGGDYDLLINTFDTEGPATHEIQKVA